MEYKVVNNPHVVPRGYLRGFADGELIGMRLVGGTESVVIPVAKAGVLKEFYRRHRRDGTPIYDGDWMLDHIDKAAPPILRGIVERWPLHLADKLALSEFVAIQMLRGPRWREWHLGFNNDYFATIDASAYVDAVPDGMTAEEAIADAERELGSDTEVIYKMFELSGKVAQILGSMHWTLLEFGRPWLATSDHPVVSWPLGARSRQPKKSDNFVEGGLVNTLEVRFPVSSMHALLMTWLDVPDDRAQIVVGSKEIATNLNAFTVAEAENQWFHLPGATVPRAAGQLLPTSPRLLPGYGADVAATSIRRTVTEQRLEARKGLGRAGEGFEVLTITPDGRVETIRVGPASAQSSSSTAA